MRAFLIIGAAAAVLASGSLAQASSLGRPCTTAPESQWLSKEALRAKAEAQGFKVRKIKIEDACGEVYVLDQSDKKVELFVDPASGEIVARK